MIFNFNVNNDKNNNIKGLLFLVVGGYVRASAKPSQTWPTTSRESCTIHIPEILNQKPKGISTLSGIKNR